MNKVYDPKKSLALYRSFSFICKSCLASFTLAHLKHPQCYVNRATGGLKRVPSYCGESCSSKYAASKAACIRQSAKIS